MSDDFRHEACILIPRVRVQNANAVSGPFTWGFPSVTAFVGFMTALERKLGSESDISFRGIGIICHRFTPLATSSGPYSPWKFHLTRNPIGERGQTMAIVEEGRAHMTISLIISVRAKDSLLVGDRQEALSATIEDLVQRMRIAGGDVLPRAATHAPYRTEIMTLAEQGTEKRLQEIKRLYRKCLPGFALVSRADLLQAELLSLRQSIPDADLLDALLSSVCRERRPIANSSDGRANQDEGAVWKIVGKPGWIVPIPVGFAPLQPLHAPGSIAGVRDSGISTAFVESILSLGQWISPHRLHELDQCLWWPSHDEEPLSPYVCVNPFPSYLS